MTVLNNITNIVTSNILKENETTIPSISLFFLYIHTIFCTDMCTYFSPTHHQIQHSLLYYDFLSLMTTIDIKYLVIKGRNFPFVGVQVF